MRPWVSRSWRNALMSGDASSGFAFSRQMQCCICITVSFIAYYLGNCAVKIAMWSDTIFLRTCDNRLLYHIRCFTWETQND
jgi:hypothetical protein